MNNKSVLLLVSETSFSRTVTQQQDWARNLLSSLGVHYFEIDGADPENRESRDQLFELSGRRAVYPQFFLVETTRETQFLGDADEMEAINDASSLDESVLSDNPYAMTWERLLGCPEEEARLVYLMSSTPLNLKTLQRQQRCELILRARNISFLLVDGSSPENKVDRNALFGISGISAQYPQFFLQKTVVHTSFLGDAEDITAINDASNLPADILEANPNIVTWDKVLAS